METVIFWAVLALIAIQVAIDVCAIAAPATPAGRIGRKSAQSGIRWTIWIPATVAGAGLMVWAASGSLVVVGASAWMLALNYAVKHLVGRWIPPQAIEVAGLVASLLPDQMPLTAQQKCCAVGAGRGACGASAPLQRDIAGCTATAIVGASAARTQVAGSIAAYLAAVAIKTCPRPDSYLDVLRDIEAHVAVGDYGRSNIAAAALAADFGHERLWSLVVAVRNRYYP